MSFRLVVRPQVDDDLQIIEEWYEEQRPGLGHEFLREVRETIDRLLANPLIYRSRYRRRQVRWAYTRRFPYRVIFRVMTIRSSSIRLFTKPGAIVCGSRGWSNTNSYSLPSHSWAKA